ncbi:bifunctional 2-polyprenyl-6-hydroxyphenol methylase/3-demethylubiquinol 3-O-methyltransferase UbiG [Selenomonas sp. ND2010]|uniref:class I SAM-dependent methyltransferase n=1 Tax=Selenomonas sp. ND2010 TaxID=1410618 RepID=UPI00051AB2CD|nr:class I SAM-dependent methyltransferase [Selenomonas sp. ND2010]
MTDKTPYDENFYRAQKDGSYRSAELTIPKLFHYVPKPKTVVDVGCGLGTWLAVFKQQGAAVVGVDGSYVQKDMLYIDAKEFVEADLEHESIASGDERFDLAVSLEVAEHLSAERAPGFIHDLTMLSDMVFFSAAVPLQGGTNHINEQWQSYWANLFVTEGYVCLDCIRPQIWGEAEIKTEYKQNILLYVKESALSGYPRLLEYYLAHRHDPQQIDMIHPNNWVGVVQYLHEIMRKQD